MKITSGLSAIEMAQAAQQVLVYRQQLPSRCKRLVQALTERGVAVAGMQIQQLGAVYTGELRDSIKGIFMPESGVGLIYAGAWYACYVEYGTGIVGQGKPHPLPKGWRYDINSHGEKGWYYYKDGAWHWTKGFESRPFMYLTAQELSRLCRQIAKEVFKA